MLKKNDDIYMALLVHRLTPISNGLSPSELLMGRNLPTPLPILPEKLTPRITMKNFRKSENKMRNQVKAKESTSIEL